MKQLLTIIVLTIVGAAAVFAAEVTDASGAELSIRFYERSLYYPGTSPAEPVLVQVTISNNTPRPLRFKLADDHFFSLDFSALTTRGRSLEHTEVWLRSRSSARQVYFREVSLETGESLSFVIDIKDFLKIPTPGMYVLQCHFYPELKRLSDKSETRIASNKLTLEVTPSPSAAAATILPVSPSTAEILRPEPMPPDQVITYILTARQKSHWSQFFLYFDLERMLSRDPARKRRFRAESEDGRLTMIENYKFELSQATIEKEIATIPVDFRIEKTMYSETEGTVSVIQWFDYRTFREKKRFTYYLSQQDGIWRVYDYTVDNLGTE